MKEIKLSQGKVALVDDDMFDYLNQFNWFYQKGTHTGYGVRKITINGERKVILMHNEILSIPLGMETDHKDRNGLNNQRHNLRVATHSQNMANRRFITKRIKSSRFIGVTSVSRKIYSKYYRQIMARIRINGEKINIGSYKTEEDAARAYDEAAKKYFGEFAVLNFKD